MLVRFPVEWACAGRVKALARFFHGRQRMSKDGPEPASESGQGRAPTMADVARAAGVSRPLVSIVVRGVPGASPETRERILRIAEEMGYRPHTAAQVLRRDRSHNVGVVFTPRQPFEVEIVEGIYPSAEMRGYQVILSAMTPARDADRAVEELLGYRSEAVILVGLELRQEWLDRLTEKVPVVRIGRHMDGSGADVVHSADDVGVREAVEFLLGLGHRQIVHVDGGDMPGADDRRAGYLSTMRLHGLATEIRVIPGDYTEEGGARAAMTLLDQGNLPTAVVAGNDWSAFGLLTTLSRQGVKVPEDISVVGYDDSRLAQLPFVQLSSVRQDAGLMAEMAVRAADERLRGVRAMPREFILQPQFVPRGTTGAARAVRIPG